MVAAMWTARDLDHDRSWVVTLGDDACGDLVAAIDRHYSPDKPLFDYRPEAFDLGCAAQPLQQAFDEARFGRGIALVKGLPRVGLDEDRFAFLTWMIGLLQGVPRPQGKETGYLHRVQDVGTDYRSSSGRGYSSNAELDFHFDGAELVALSCFNDAREGGLSLAVSCDAVVASLKREYPELIPLLRDRYEFSLQNEQQAGMPGTTQVQLLVEEDGHAYIRWNRNRIVSAQQLEGVTPIDERHWHALETLDAVIRRSDHVATMMLEPGDMQILNNYRCLHSRTEFVDEGDESLKRLLFRLWLSPPSGAIVPAAVGGELAGLTDVVRGGTLGQHYDENCRAFEERIARFHGMRLP